MFGKRKFLNEIGTLPYLIRSANNRLGDEALAATEAWFQGRAYGNGLTYLKAAIQSGSITGDDTSFRHEVFQPTYDELLNVAKKNLNTTVLSHEYEMQLTQKFLQRVSTWLGIPADFMSKPHIEVLAVVYIGAVLDCYLQPRPQMKIAGQLSAEVCSEVAALTASSWLEAQGK